VALVTAAHKLLTILNVMLQNQNGVEAATSRIKQEALSDSPSQRPWNFGFVW